MINLLHNIADRLEQRWVAPSYSGWLLFVLSLCLFGAATNSMAGWLYVISGMNFALLLIAAILPSRSLRKLNIERQAIVPVSAGEDLTITLRLENLDKSPKTLLQVWDCLPLGLGNPQAKSFEAIPPQEAIDWSYFYPTQQRGVYHWQTVELRTGTPLGLFWCRRAHHIPTRAIVYPQVLPLAECPILDAIGTDENLKIQSDRRYQAATEGVTKTLRPYRIGDPMRLIHWRSSARLGEFQVRELEIVTGGQEVAICLDSAATWNSETFEMAVIAAASLYFYAQRAQLNVHLWTAGQGLTSGSRMVLESLASVQRGEAAQAPLPRHLSLLWLTNHLSDSADLTPGSRWLQFGTNADAAAPVLTAYPGRLIDIGQDLVAQLQKLERT